jgi:hypothetical protein
MLKLKKMNFFFINLNVSKKILHWINSFKLDNGIKKSYYNFEQVAMVKSVDMLLLKSNARASQFESKWWHNIFKLSNY